MPLLFATQPRFLDHTKLPPQFTAVFSIWQEKELNAPKHLPDNKLFYLETLDGKRYMKAYFGRSVLIPGEPVRFKGTSVLWFVMPDSSQGGAYTARVYSVQRREWALVAINLGPPRRDMISRFYDHLTVQPSSTTPPNLPAGDVTSRIPAEWFFTSGNNKCGPSKTNPGYFAVRTTLVEGAHGEKYKLPLSLVGGGAGAVHQAYGQLVYEKIDLSPGLTPASFNPPANYTLVSEPNQHPVAMNVLIAENCAVCHYKDPGTTQFYQPPPPKNMPPPPKPECL